MRELLTFRMSFLTLIEEPRSVSSALAVSLTSLTSSSIISFFWSSGTTGWASTWCDMLVLNNGGTLSISSCSSCSYTAGHLPSMIRSSALRTLGLPLVKSVNLDQVSTLPNSGPSRQSLSVVGPDCQCQGTTRRKKKYKEGDKLTKKSPNPRTKDLLRGSRVRAPE